MPVVKIGKVEIVLRRGIFFPNIVNTEIFLEATRKKIRILRGCEKIADFGSGSGILGVAVAKKFPQKKVALIDSSRIACTMSQINAKKNNLSNVTTQRHITDDFDCIISNPPYLSLLEALRDIFFYPDLLFQPIFSIISIRGRLYFFKKILDEFSSAKYFFFYFHSKNADKTMCKVESKYPVTVEKIGEFTFFLKRHRP